MVLHIYPTTGRYFGPIDRRDPALHSFPWLLWMALAIYDYNDRDNTSYPISLFQQAIGEVRPPVLHCFHHRTIEPSRLEAVVKIIAMGFVVHKNSYL